MSTKRELPHSADAEQQVLACCLLDEGMTVTRARAEGLHAEAFYDAAHRTVYAELCRMQDAKKTITIETVCQELQSQGTLAAVGGAKFFIELSSKAPTTAHAGYFIGKVRADHLRRETIKAAMAAAEQAFNMDEVSDVLAGLRRKVGEIERADVFQVIDRPLTKFEVPPDGDRSILLGNRYLNRGDGAALISSSGMGKSSMTLQAAVEWALGRPFFGIAPNGPLKSIIIQAEDSDGDVGEVWLSILHGLELTKEQVAQVEKNVIVISERVKRGPAFLALVRALVEKHKPDLVWVNPLFSFMDGDLNDAKDAGQFLREGLNAINTPPSFGYIVVHHTAKPKTGKDRGDRRWNELMYEGAGSGELTNWARAIITLSATETKGEFVCNLAKRGSRAGVVVEVDHEGVKHFEPVLEIPLRHATGKVEVPGRKRPLPLILWEYREPKAAAPEEAAKPARPSKSTLPMAAFLKKIPASTAKEGKPAAEIGRELQELGFTGTMARTFYAEAMNAGLIIFTKDNRYIRTSTGDDIAES